MSSKHESYFYGVEFEKTTISMSLIFFKKNEDLKK